MATENTGFLQQYGLDLDRDKLQEQDLRQRQAVGMHLADGLGLRGTAARGGAQTGALLAAALQNRNYQPTDDQSSRIATARDTQQAMEAWLAQNPEATASDRAMKYQEFLAENAFRYGLPDVGASVLTQLDEKKRARQKQDLELENLGIETRVNRATEQDRIESSKLNLQKGKLVPEAYVVGSKDPNSTVSGVLQDDYSLLTGDGRRIPAGSWHTSRPMAPSQLGGGGSGSRWTLTPTEAGFLRNSLQAVDNQLRKTIEIDDLFLEFGKNPGQFIGDVGKVTGFADRMVRFAENFADAIDPTGEGGDLRITNDGTNEGKTLYDLSSPAGRARFSRKESEYIRSILPANLKRNAEMANRYQALVVEFAYATARAQEPGAKALTDADFKRAVQAIGGSLNDPVALRKIMFSRAMQANSELNFRFSMYSDDVLGQVFTNPQAQRDYKQRVEEVNKRLSYDKSNGNPTGSSYGTDQMPGTWRIIP